MRIKILVQEANNLIYFVRYNPIFFHKRPHKIVGYGLSFCKSINMLIVHRWEFEQTSDFAEVFYKRFKEWVEGDENT